MNALALITLHWYSLAAIVAATALATALAILALRAVLVAGAAIRNGFQLDDTAREAAADRYGVHPDDMAWTEDGWKPIPGARRQPMNYTDLKASDIAAMVVCRHCGHRESVASSRCKNCGESVDGSMAIWVDLRAERLARQPRGRSEYFHEWLPEERDSEPEKLP